jgi:hypothetical protein
MARKVTEWHESSLPVFIVNSSQDYPGWLIVACTRDGCGHKFVVKKSEWRRKRYGIKNNLLIGRPCPYCFKVSRIPDRINPPLRRN